MLLRIVHETTYRYDQPPRSLIQLLRLTPSDYGGQHVRAWRIEPSVDGRLKARSDALGNRVHLFSSEAVTDELRIQVTGEVETSETNGLVEEAVERVPDLVFLRDTDLTQPDAAIREFARDVSAAESEPLPALHRLLTSLNREIAFDTEPTNAGTTAADAFALRRGVCQDLTHIFIGAARCLGIPARYVSGYFRRSDGVVHQKAGHAWAEAKVPHLGWIGFDAMNGVSTTAAHVRVAIGLDYLGAAPVRGSRAGGGSEHLDVDLWIDEVQRQSQGQSQS